MTMTNELEARLTTTLRAVADQTEVTPGDRPTAPIDIQTGQRPPAGRPGRQLWLAAAAVLAIAVGSAAYLTARGDQVTVEAADDPSTTPPPIGDDGVLYLLPPDIDQLTGPADFAAGDDVARQTTGSQILVGRTVEGGYEDLMLVFHTTGLDTVAIDEATSQTVAGRLLFDSYDEGVAEQLDDGSWIVYQDEFESPFHTEDVLSEVVAGTSFVDGELVFDGTIGSGGNDGPDTDALEVIARLAPGTERATSTLTILPTLTDEPPAGTPGGLTLTTFSIERPEQVLVEGSELAPSLTETMVGDRPAHRYDLIGPDQSSITFLTWSPFDDYGASLVLWGMTGSQATDYAASLVPVDGATWVETLTELE